MAPGCVHKHPGTGLAWLCLCLHTHTHTEHARSHTHIQGFCACTKAPALRCMGGEACVCASTQIYGVQHDHLWVLSVQIHCCMCAFIHARLGAHTCVSQHTYRAQYASPALRVAMSVFVLIPCVLKLQLFLVCVLSTRRKPNSRRFKQPSSLDKVYRAHLFA